MGTVLFFGVGFFVIAGMTIVLFQLTARYMYSYRLSERAVEFRLFGLIPFWRIPFADIVDVREVPFTGVFVGESSFSPTNLRLLRFGNRIGPAVIIERVRGGIARWIAITPDNPADFVAKVRGRIATKSTERHQPGRNSPGV